MKNWTRGMNLGAVLNLSIPLSIVLNLSIPLSIVLNLSRALKTLKLNYLTYFFSNLIFKYDT